MIITWLTGGLGNQMFQYAAGLALAERRRTVLKLDVSWYRDDPTYEAHNRYALSCFNITEQFATEEEVDRIRGVNLSRMERASVRLARALRFYRYAARHERPGRCHYAENFCFYPGFFEISDDTYIHGMWQSERFFAPVADLLRLHFSFRYPAQPAVEEMARRIRGQGPSAAMHFRRGDYVRNETFNRQIGVLDLDYYRRAEARLREREPGATLYIFSDDIDAIEREFRPSGPHVFVRATQHWHSYDKIRLMSLCDHAIISNSTFAWWGAWLGSKPGKLVIAPDPWMAGGPHDHRDVVPDTWTRLPRAG
ncbi:MAG TPA: alpha-1,2-fucosyltransferase, partial [Opitutaceae bacterium]|nr:alpha-1,2-fucosyltransferase [Opitutaceae bacterium]